MNYQIIRLREEIEECEKVLAEDRGGIPLPLGARGLHAVTVHFFSRQIIKKKGERFGIKRN